MNKPKKMDRQLTQKTKPPSLAGDESDRAAFAWSPADPDLNNIAVQLLGWAEETCQPGWLFTSEKMPFAKIRRKEQVSIIPVESKNFRAFLTWVAMNVKGKPPSAEALDNAVRLADAMTRYDYDKLDHRLSLRIAFDDGTLYYDLSEGGKVIRVTGAGWELLDETPVPMFKSFDHQKPAVMPNALLLVRTPEELGRDLCRVFELVNCPGEYKNLFRVHLVCSFIPDIPRPIPVVYGSEGTAKTSFLEIWKALVDPSRVATLTMPRSTEEFVQMMGHHSFLVLDNVTGTDDQGLSSWVSDLLCRVVTGQGFSKRKLYSDDEDVFCFFMHMVAINGINNVATQPDLLRRAILYELPEIRQKQRLTRTQLWGKFTLLAADLLGTIFDILSKALSLYNDVHTTGLYDMADFTKWGIAISQAMGLDPDIFLKEYSENMALHNTEAIENDIVGSVLQSLLDKPLEHETVRNERTISEPLWSPDELEDSPTKILEYMQDRAKELGIDIKVREWPKSPNALGRKLKRLRTTFTKIGIELFLDLRQGGTGARRYRLRRAPAILVTDDIVSQLPEQDSLESAMADDISNKNGASGDSVTRKEDVVE